MVGVFRDYRGVRSSLFEGLEEGVNRASSSYSAHSSLEISDQDNDRSLDGLKDKVGILKKVRFHPFDSSFCLCSEKDLLV